jgi:hypothetical protein
MEAKIAEVSDLNCNALKALYENFFLILDYGFILVKDPRPDCIVTGTINDLYRQLNLGDQDVIDNGNCSFPF